MKRTLATSLVAATLGAALTSGSVYATGYADPPTFDAATGVLTVPMVSLYTTDSTLYYSAVLTLTAASPRTTFAISSLTELTPDPSTYSSNMFDTYSNTLYLYDVDVTLGQRRYQYSVDLALEGNQFVLNNLTDNTYIQMSSPVLTASNDYSGTILTVPTENTCDGSDVSPELSWSSAPEGTVSYAVYAYDVNAGESGYDTWVHWLVADIPADTSTMSHQLAGGVGSGDAAPDGGVNGLNDWSETGYRGPCPPTGTGDHNYYFKVYALDTTLNLSEGFDYAAFSSAADGHILQEAYVTGTYRRD